MSVSARRLAGAAVIDRFEWQRPDAPAPPAGPVPFFGARDRARDAGLREFALPGLSEERAAAVEQEAFARGYADGARAAETAAAARIDEMLARFADTIREVAALRAGVLQGTEREVVRLALAMAERMVRRQIDADPAVLVSIARAAAAALGSRVVATIHLNPADHARVAEGDSPGSIALRADPQVPRGGVVVRSDAGTIDASVDAQIRELTRALLGDDAESDSDGDARP
jgi:flagellar biosynthesis/type III secretory pathway protein FliH